MSFNDIYQNLLYGPADPFSAASTELYKQQTIGMLAMPKIKKK